MRHGEVGVEFYGAPEEGNSCTIASLSPRDICRGIGLQGLQRRRRNLVKGNVESPDRIQRLTQRLPHSQHVQYFFLGCSLDLLLREYLAGIAVHRLQSNHVLSAEAGDGARQHGLAAVRTQISLATSGESPSPGARPISFRVSRTIWSGRRLRKGDWESCAERPCFRVSSNTGSPVMLVKSARTMESFSVSGRARRE